MSSLSDKTVAMIESIGKGEINKFADMFAEDGIMYHPSYADPGLDAELEIKGRENVRKVLQTWNEAFAVDGVEIFDVMEKGDNVFIFWCCKRHHRETGEKFKAEAMSYITFKDGMIVSYKVYFDNVK